MSGRRHTQHPLVRKRTKDYCRSQKYVDSYDSPRGDVSAIKLKRTDTTLDLSQERQREGKEKRAGFHGGRGGLYRIGECRVVGVEVLVLSHELV